MYNVLFNPHVGRKIHIHVMQSKHSSKSPASPLVPHLLRDGNVGEIIFSEEPALKTFKWGNTFRFIFQVQFLECLSDESSNQKQRAGLSNLAEVTALGSLQSCVPVESWGISLVSQPSTAHSLLIYQSLPPSRLSQLQLGPCDCCLSHLTLRWLALMSLSTRKSRAPSLNRAEGDYATASPRGWNNF